MSTKGSSAGNNIDAKREEFRKYLEKEGVLEYLTKQLVRLYEEADKPSNALDYLKNNFSGKDTEVAQLKAENLEKENVQLKEKIKVLESEKAELESRIKELSEASTANGSTSPSETQQQQQATPKDNAEKTDLDEDEPMDAVEEQSSNKLASEDKSDPTSGGDELSQGDTDTKKDNLEESGDAKQGEVPSDSAMDSSTATTTNEMKSDAEDSSATQV